MTGITQGSGFRETQTSSQTTSSSTASSASTASTTLLKNAVGGIQNQSGQSSLGGNNTALINLIQQLVDQIGKNKGGCQPQPQPLTLSAQQDKAIRERFNIGGAMSYQVLDSKKDGKLSAGDTLVMSGGITGGEISRQKLTAKDVKAINSGSTSTPQQQLDANRQKWDSLGISDYSFTLQRSCFCTPDSTRPITIQVRGDSVTSARYADTGELIPDDRQTNKQSIYNMNADGVFNLIEQGIKSGAAQVDAKYDAQYGLPTSIYIDQNQQMADEEMGYTISNFQPEPMFTTMMMGEEDGGGPIIQPPIKPPIMTTMMVGEEDGGVQPCPVKPPIEPPMMTTMALGEEDGCAAI
ncbi:DUF6174 domain-containing protein [Thiothrix fructosivorans]|uniref:Uncharacterized protein n=1 Tax=Thiothrix fructosivorans TaxID=111770 RepID=A0A8B0SKC0_9GAMM|nr:DUF6174 domain-containing protein [Thiothrix fructosivorans]MBO0613644.1 hypothetical protein [Thiothrix fructosivorans]QTX10940.1 hypothetical protein J1836_000750 [Thiothrix fructosivorans]